MLIFVKKIPAVVAAGKISWVKQYAFFTILQFDQSNTGVPPEFQFIKSSQRFHDWVELSSCSWDTILSTLSTINGRGKFSCRLKKCVVFRVGKSYVAYLSMLQFCIYATIPGIIIRALLKTITQTQHSNIPNVLFHPIFTSVSSIVWT